LEEVDCRFGGFATAMVLSQNGKLVYFIMMKK